MASTSTAAMSMRTELVPIAPTASRGALWADDSRDRRAAEWRTKKKPLVSQGLVRRILDILKRGRRGSNPQPPDRQSGTLTN